MAKMGRPKLDDPRKHAVMIRLTDSEYSELIKRAKKYNLTIAEAVRKEISFLNKDKDS